MTWWKQKLFRVGGSSLSMPQTAAYFAERNGISTEPAVTRLPPAKPPPIWNVPSIARTNVL